MDNIDNEYLPGSFSETAYTGNVHTNEHGVDASSTDHPFPDDYNAGETLPDSCPTILSTDSLLVVRGNHPGARIALTAGKTVLGEDGNPIICIRKSFGHFSVSTADATVLVTHNGDPLPPAPKGIRNNDSICFRDTELICELDEPDAPYA